MANRQGILQIKARLGKPRAGRKDEPVYRIGDKSIAGWVVQNKRSYLCSNVENDQFFASSRSGRNFSSLLSVPIIHENKVLAVINADATEKNYFTEIHQKQLEEVARHVSAPIAERISILDALAEVGIELTRLPREGGVEPVLKKIAQLAVRSLGADVVTLYQYVQEKDEFPVEGTGPIIAGAIGDPGPMRRRVYPGDVPWTVVKERKSGFYSDVHKEDFLTRDVQRLGETPRPRFIDREGITSMAALLLPYRAAQFKDEEVVGVMFANYHSYHEFNIDEISALATFADYAAVAILNARHEEQRHQEQMRIETQRREEQLKIVETISANFAHRMGNLAGTSRVATQLLRERIDPLDDLAHRQLNRIEREASILLGLAKQLARPFRETGRIFDLVPMDIMQILKEELERIRLELVEPFVHMVLEPNLPEVQSVDFQLRQVLHDIINNAIEATKEQEDRQLTIRARFNTNTNHVEVEVSDNGPGVRHDVRDRLFAPGVTTKNEKLGIGLWWSQTFMRATGGDVVLKYTELGKGTAFLIEIPCLGAEKGVFPEKKGKDILIVDDMKRWQEQLVDALSDRPYSFKLASNYVEAQNALKSSQFKLAVMDVRLVDADSDNEDGLRLLAEINEADLDTRVIIVTSYGTDQHKETASKNPKLLAFINKDEFDVSTFRRLVRQVVNPTR